MTAPLLDDHARLDPSDAALTAYEAAASALPVDEPWLRALHDRIERAGRVRVPLGRAADGDVGLARRLAAGIVRDLALLVARVGLEDAEAELDRPQETAIPTGAAVRTLLPHHDGQHASFLTPSRIDVPWLDARWRRLAGDRFTTADTHKVYQGIFLARAGSPPGVTSYYPWLRVIADARARATGDARPPDAPEVAAWVGERVRNHWNARRRIGERGVRYLSLIAMLGVDDPPFDRIAPHYAEAPFTAEERARVPELDVCASCPCGACAHPGDRFWCAGVSRALGIGWQEFRARYEIGVEGEDQDLIVGHNLTVVHGGLRGSGERLLEPMCVVTRRPHGEAYERWLARTWRRAAAAQADLAAWRAGAL